MHSSTITLFKTTTGATATLTSATSAMTAGTVYTLRAVANGNTVQLHLDGVLKITHTLAGGDDVTFNQAGYTKVGLRVSGANSGNRFDDFAVTA